MGTVYAAVDVTTGESAAVKMLTPSLAQEEGFRERFEAEIETLKKLNHPNIVQLYAYGETEGQLFFAMELVAGTSLEDEIAHGRPFQWREACHIGMQICRALKHAHDRGVIHRDLKPANLLLSDSGMVKLSDFGIAKLFGSTGMTGQGGLLGTAEYMAPEQTDGRSVTHRSDLYSLGGVLYALLARRPPFRSTSVPELLQLQRFAQPEPVGRLNADVPREFDEIILQLLAKEAQSRFPNAQVVLRRLEAMERSLSLESVERKAGRAARPPISGGDPEFAADVASGSDADSATVAATQSDASAAGPSNGHRASVAPTPPREPGPPTPQAAPADRDASAKITVDRFTMVRPDERDKALLIESPGGGLISIQTIVLAVLLLGLGVLAWYVVQPRTADSLYESIVAGEKVSNADSPRGIEDEIEQFLARFPRDPRTDHVKRLLEEIELDRLEKKLELKSRLSPTRTGSLTPVERAYIEAVRQLRVDAVVGRARLSAVVDLYDEAAQSNTSTRLCLELARRQIARLDEISTELGQGQFSLLESRLEEAIARSGEDPQAARRICAAIVELYSGHAWAEPLVHRAKEAMESLE
jgi:serine/threonine-protein kinase